ncbi:hypothetical protein C1645_820031 [Glomus cerebriforme]|uniref:Uncharacterized protein n=1 Tax=Glomus cerebriforme TaxID=658196 RepID=A0A397T3I6_9GLOM|nr:hypothetical protein C1645_820031 [Glomus cerebriforme]
MSENLQENILKIVQSDENGLTFLSAKFNPERANIIRTNGISNVEVDKKSKRSNRERKLPDDIADSINDSEFWATLFSLQNLLYPLYGFLNKLQKDTAHLYEVMHYFAYITKIFSEYHDLDFSEKIISRMEKKWKDWEQPLLLLSITLHPSYNIDKENLITVSDNDNNNVNNNNNKEKSEVELNTEENKNQWNTIISQWIEETNYENQVKNSEDELLLNGDFDNDFLVGMRNIHPADDQNAKWELSLLFINNLELSTYTEFFSNINE